MRVPVTVRRAAISPPGPIAEGTAMLEPLLFIGLIIAAAAAATRLGIAAAAPMAPSRLDAWDGRADADA